MDKHEAIIDKIIADAKETAVNIENGSKQNAEEIQKNTEVTVKKYETKERNELTKNCELVLERKKTVATLDGRKISLKAKQDLINECFEEAERKLISLPKKDYLKFIESQISEYAENDDEVIVGNNEKHIDIKFIEEIAKKKDIKLTLSDKKGDFEGGIILRSKILDKNLTVKAILRSLKKEIELEVAQILFG